MGLQAKTVAQARMQHWLTVFNVQGVICINIGMQFFGAWFRTMCKYLGVRHTKTVTYHSRSNERAGLRAGYCSRNSCNCILRGRAEIGIIPFRRLCSHTTTYLDRLVCLRVVSHSCGIGFHVLARG